MKKKKALKIAQSRLHGKRLLHSIGAAKVAASMGKQLGEHPEKLYVAGLLHDIVKPWKKSELVAAAKKYGYPVDDIQQYSPGLLHAPVASLVLSNEYGEKDTAILEAIQFHTTGTSSMTLFAQIIYAADFLDPYRGFPQQQKAWKHMEKDFHLGLLYICRFFLKKVSKKIDLVHPDSIHFLNDVVLTCRSKKKKMPVFRKDIITWE